MHKASKNVKLFGRILFLLRWENKRILVSRLLEVK